MSSPQIFRAHSALRTATLILGWLVIACLSAWGAAALYFASYTPESVYALDKLDRKMFVDALSRTSKINEAERTADEAEDFLLRIRTLLLGEKTP